MTVAVLSWEGPVPATVADDRDGRLGVRGERADGAGDGRVAGPLGRGHGIGDEARAERVVEHDVGRRRRPSVPNDERERDRLAGEGGVGLDALRQLEVGLHDARADVRARALLVRTLSPPPATSAVFSIAAGGERDQERAQLDGRVAAGRGSTSVRVQVTAVATTVQLQPGAEMTVTEANVAGGNVSVTVTAEPSVAAGASVRDERA